VLVAIAVSIVILALTGAHHATTSNPVTPSQAVAGSVPQTHYLGPRQDRAGLNPQTTQTQAGGATAPHYTCLEAAQHCLP